MRYLKKLSIHKFQPASNKFAELIDGRIITDTHKSLQVPVGSTEERPTVVGPDYDGMLRYNSTNNEFEVYNYENPGFTRWEYVRTIRQGVITPQHLGSGTYHDSVFGPLSYNVDTDKPQNVFVFVDNVYQDPTRNYSLISNPSPSTATLSISTSSAVTRLYLSTLTNINVGSEPWRTVSGSPNIQAGTTVTNVINNYNYIYQGYPVDISIPTTGSISLGTEISVNYSAGTYIQFTSPAPARPVFSLLGVDGYWPIP
jgi:hypothetical protein